MDNITPADRVRLRTVRLQVKRIREHLEAMQRDAHGVEYAPWKNEVDNIWKITFENINEMSEAPQAKRAGNDTRTLNDVPVPLRRHRQRIATKVPSPSTGKG